MSTVAIIGIPALTYGVKRIAIKPAMPAAILVFLVLSLGQTNPRNAAGTAASSPQVEGFPIACAPSAPNKVKRFQKI